MKKLIILLIILVVAYLIIQGGIKYLPSFQNAISLPSTSSGNTVKVESEESVIIDVVKKISPSVVTIGVESSPQSNNNQFPGFDQGPFSFFFGNPGGQQPPDQNPAPSPDQNQYIGSGFVVDKSGIIVTNKHVVSDTSQTYVVVDQKGNKYTISNIYRDPLNDLALIKISNPPSGGLPPVTLGDSTNLQVGQLVVAIGTPLGQFRNSATHGIISGLGRGITAGSPFEGSTEQLNDVIQTDAAINPGNSGGPLVNSSGQVIGINTAVAQQGQNIGFAIPINVVKDSLKNFNATGQFNRPFLGVAYTMIDQQTAVLNSLPQGAYVEQVTPSSAADQAGIQQGDIITKVDGNKLDPVSGLSSIIANKKVGDALTLTIYRNGNTQDVKATLQQAPNQ